MNLFSHDQREATLAASAFENIEIHGDFYYIDSLYTVSDGQATKINLAVNDGRFTVCATGQSRQGVAGGDQIKKLKFQNTSGAPVFLRVLYGKGICNFAPNITIEFAAGAVEALADAINNAQELEAFEDSALAALETYTLCKAIEIEALNDGLVIDLPDGSITLNTGDIRNWSVENDQDWLSDFVVHGTGAIGARVTGLRYAS